MSFSLHVLCKLIVGWCTKIDCWNSCKNSPSAAAPPPSPAAVVCCCCYCQWGCHCAVSTILYLTMFFLIKHFVDGVFLFLKNIENSSFFSLCCILLCLCSFCGFLKNFMSFFDFINFMSSSSSSSSSKKGSLLGGANFLVQD